MLEHRDTYGQAVTSDLVTNGTLSRTGFGGHVRRRVFSKRVRNLAYNEHVALSHLLSAGHGLALGYK